MHRKLMPTAAERLIWGFGDGSTTGAIDSDAGRLGCAICWENYMPAYRLFLYSQGVQIWCAPTVDDREMWRTSMRHIAYEGRCFVLSACQFMFRKDYPEDYAPVHGDDPETVMIGGGSLIASPTGTILAGPAEPGEQLLIADIDIDEVTRGKFDLDVSGHYSRPDIFSLEVDRRARKPVVAQDSED